MIEVAVEVLRVFCGPGGSGGNPLGVVLDGAAVAEDDRQGIARMLGYSETVFVEDAATGRIRIYTPAVELPFAGHPCVGTGWLLRQRGEDAEALLTPAGKVGLRHEADRPDHCWATARAQWSPGFELVELAAPEDVEAAEPNASGMSYVWSWLDEAGAIVRARSFVADVGIAEDEATGSAAIALCAALGRPIEVRQGRGSVIHARPLEDGPGDLIEFGGRIVAD